MNLNLVQRQSWNVQFIGLHIDLLRLAASGTRQIYSFVKISSSYTCIAHQDWCVPRFILHLYVDHE
jgi:hypothetical protein